MELRRNFAEKVKKKANMIEDSDEIKLYKKEKGFPRLQGRVICLHFVSS